MTRQEEIATIRILLGAVRIFRDCITECTQGNAKAEMLAQADATIAKAELALARLEHPNAPVTATLPQPERLQ